MRIYVLIAIMVLLLTIPSASGMAAFQSTGTGASPSQMNYDFQDMPAGSQPANKSWIHFYPQGYQGGLKYGVINTSLGNGLNIYSHTGSGAAYLEMDMNFTPSMTVSMNFSWNTASMLSLTEDHLFFNSSGHRLFDVKFGPYIEEMMDISNSTSTTQAGNQPVHNSMLRFSVSFYRDHPHVATITLEKSGAGIATFPLKAMYTAQTGSNLTVGIGGAYSNLTVFNLSVNDNSPAYVPEYGGALHYNETSFTLARGLRASEKPALHPYLDTQLNSVVYYSSARRIAAYNYYNSTSSNLTGNISIDAGGTFTKGELYYWTSNGTVDLVGVNASTLSAGTWDTGIYLGGSVNALFRNSTVMFYNTTGNWARYNLESGSISQGVFGGFSGHDYALLSLVLNGSIIRGTALSGNGTHELRFSSSFTSPSNGSFSILGIPAVSGPASACMFEPGQGTSSIISLSGDSSARYVAEADGNVAISPLSAQFSSVLSVVGNTTMISAGSRMYLLNASGSLYSTGMTLPAGNYSVSLSEGGWSMVALSGRTAHVYYRNSTIPVSTSGIKIIGKSSYLLSSTGDVNFTVESSTGYMIQLQSPFLSMRQKDQASFTINSTSLPGGPENAYVNATNEAGMNDSINVTLIIDNYIPHLSTDPVNSSYISGNTAVNYTISDGAGIRTVNITSPGASESYAPDSSSFTLSPGSATGEYNITFHVTDSYGIGSSLAVTYFIVGYNSTSGLNLWNHEYLDTGKLDLSWNSQNNVSSYSVEAMGLSENITDVTASNHTALATGNGNFTVYLHATLLSGRTVLLAEDNITVMDYSPGISFSRMPHGVYSFTGDSARNSFGTEISSNVSASISAKVMSPGNRSIFLLHGNRRLNLSFARHSMLLRANGTYTVVVNATSPSGTESSESVHIEVNNTVPESPYTGNTSIYTNGTSVYIPLDINADLSYSASISKGNMSGSLSTYSGVEASLVWGNGTYALNITDSSQSGNYNTSIIKVYHYQAKPVINYSVKRKVMDTASTLLKYSFSDMVPMKPASITMNGNPVNISMNGSVMLHFTHNGIYNISIHGEDVCGNQNTTGTISVNVSYYIQPGHVWISSTKSGGVYKFHVHFSGNGLSRSSISWYIGGNKVSSGSSFSSSLPVGIHRVTAVVKYQGRTSRVGKQVVVLGYTPVLLIPAAIVPYAAYRKAFSNTDEDEISGIMEKFRGRPFREAVKEARKSRIRPSVMRKQARRLESRGTIVIATDPDGARFIMAPDEKR